MSQVERHSQPKPKPVSFSQRVGMVLAWTFVVVAGLSLSLIACRPVKKGPTRKVLSYARDYLGWKTLTVRKITNSHKTPNNNYSTAEIYLNKAAYAISNGDEKMDATGYPAGSTFVYISYTDNDEKVPFGLVMRKMGNDYDPDNGNWRYSIVRLSDWTLVGDGKLVGCIKCHEKSRNRDYIPVMRKDFTQPNY